MKKRILLSITVITIGLASCKREAPLADPVLVKILGKWQLQRTVEEYYHPVDDLVEMEEFVGTEADSVVFKADHMVFSYSPFLDTGVDEQPFRLVNDSTIEIDDELYKIRKLTATEMYLYQEEISTATNERYINKGYFVR